MSFVVISVCSYKGPKSHMGGRSEERGGLLVWQSISGDHKAYPGSRSWQQDGWGAGNEAGDGGHPSGSWPLWSKLTAVCRGSGQMDSFCWILRCGYAEIDVWVPAGRNTEWFPGVRSVLGHRFLDSA